MNQSYSVQQELPLTEATSYILLCLTTEPQHGYAIMKEVESLSQGRVRLSTGTLYGALKRLLEQQWIVRVDDDAGENGRTRKAYHLTELGRRVLDAEIDRLQSLVAVAGRRVAGVVS